MRIGRATVRRGFSLIEAMVVVVIIGILSASAAPMLGSQGMLRERAAATEVAGLLRTARGFAMATGEPCGVRIRVAEDSLGLVTWSPVSRESEPLTDLGGAAFEALGISDTFSGARLATVTDGRNGGEDVTIWFGHDGAPQWRDSGGSLLGVAEANGGIVFQGGTSVTIVAVSGAIE